MKNCPACENQFKEITDFPIVQVESAFIFDDKQITSAIVDKYKDTMNMGQMTRRTKEISNLLKSNDALTKFSKDLEAAIGKELRVDDLLPVWVYSADRIPGAEEYSIIVFEERDSPSKYRSTTIRLFKGPNPGISREILKIGKIEYRGRINPVK